MSLPGSPDVAALSVYSIGLKLRALRAAKHLTLSQLAALTGCSTALLSKLETEHMVPTLQTLDRICRAFGVSLGHFFCESRHHTVSITRHEDDRERREPHPARSTPLNVRTCEGLLLSQILAIPAGVSVTTGDCGNVTETAVHVLEGAVHVSLTRTSEVLETGDSIVVTSDKPVLWTAHGGSCRVLCVSAKRPEAPASASDVATQ